MYSLKPKLLPEILMLKPRLVLKDMRILKKGSIPKQNKRTDTAEGIHQVTTGVQQVGILDE